MKPAAPLLLAAALAPLASAPPPSAAQGSPTDPVDVRELVDAAYRRLLMAQHPDGGWGDPARTAICAHALLACSPSEEAVTAARKAVAAMPALIESLGNPLPPGTKIDSRLFGIAWAIAHLHGVRRRWPASSPPPDFAPAVSRLAELAAATQKPSGGWRYDVEGEFPGDTNGSQLFITSVMVEGLLRWKDDKAMKIDPAALDRGIADVKKSCDGHGWCAYNHHGDYKGVGHAKWAHCGSAGRSIQAHLLLLDAGKGKPDMVRRFLDAFFKGREEYVKLRTAGDHTPPYGIHGGYYYHAHHYAACALRRLTSDPEGFSRVLVDSLAREHKAGGWTDLGGDLYGTAMAALILAEVTVPWTKETADEKKPRVVLVTDRGRASALLETALGLEMPRDVVARFTWSRRAFSRDDAQLKAAKIDRAPAILRISPDGSAAKISGWKTIAQLARTLSE